MKEKFLQLNIAFRIPEEVAKIAMNLSEEIAQKEDAYFVLDGVEYFPHATNYAVEFPAKNLDKIIKAVEQLSLEFLPFEVSTTMNIADQGWIGVYFEYSNIIRKMHSAFVKNLNPLRENRIRDKFESDDRFSPEDERENIAKFGHPWVMELYEPHLTITKLKDEAAAEKVAREMIWPIKKFKVDTVGIFIGGEHGTCRKLIREFRLGKA